MIAPRTLTTIIMLAPTLQTFRALQLAHRDFYIDAAQKFHARVRFRTLRHPWLGAYQHVIHDHRPDGLYVTTYGDDNNSVARIEWFVNGISHGICKSWYQSGEVNELFTFHNGMMHGEYRLWSKSGQLRYLTNFTNDVPIGLHKEWTTNGVLRKHCINLPLT